MGTVRYPLHGVESQKEALSARAKLISNSYLIIPTRESNITIDLRVARDVIYRRQFVCNNFPARQRDAASSPSRWPPGAAANAKTDSRS